MGDNSGAEREARAPADFNQSVARAVRVLDALAGAEGDMELGITELSDETGLAKSVVSRLLAPLVAGGYVERNARTRRYRVGLRAFELGLTYLRHPGTGGPALVFLDELARETGHTAYLSVLDDTQCVVLAAVEGNDRLRVVVSAGERAPVYATAMGKAILAGLEEPRREQLLAVAVEGEHNARRPGSEGNWRVLPPAALRADLEATGTRGYAVTKDDGYPGVLSVGVALPVQGGRHMAVSIDIPAYTGAADDVHALGRLLVKKARSSFAPGFDHHQTIGLGTLL